MNTARVQAAELTPPGLSWERPERTWLRWVAGALIVPVLVAGGWLSARLLQPQVPRVPPGPASSNATVERMTLTETETLSGKLTYEGSYSVPAQRGGTVTWIAEEGSVVERGGKLFEADGVPVSLMYGERPAWRALAKGTEGPDVRQLEENLRALGHDSRSAMTVDGEFDAATESALKRWQKAQGLDQDGVLDLGEVVFLPSAIRVASREAAPGSPAQGEVLKASSTTPVVVHDLDATKQHLARVGDEVRVTMPDGRTTAGTVTKVAKVAKAQASDNGQEGDPTVAVTISLNDPTAASGLDQAPVEIEVSANKKEGVLAVPVNALLALKEGGYAVEVRDSGRVSRLVAVETGMFAQGYVEVSGSGLEEGAKLVVPE